MKKKKQKIIIIKIVKNIFSNKSPFFKINYLVIYFVVSWRMEVGNKKLLFK
jgi:hypothetical protein